jgi:hypothetical protein
MTGARQMGWTDNVGAAADPPQALELGEAGEEGKPDDVVP